MLHASDNWIVVIVEAAMVLLILFRVISAIRGNLPYIRRIAGLNAIDEAIGRATEMGRPVLMVPGITGLDIVGIQALNIFQYITRTAAKFSTPIRLCLADPILYTVAQEVIQDAYRAEGNPEEYDPESVRFVASQQFAFAAGVSGLIQREQVAATFFLGAFYAESLIFAETANIVGAIQVAGTVQTTQTPFFIAACDYVIIGDEFYAASAYLSREPVALGSLVGQDYVKLLITLVIFVSILWYGVWNLWPSTTKLTLPQAVTTPYSGDISKDKTPLTAIAGGNTIRVYDPENRKAMTDITNGQIGDTPVLFHPQGTVLAAGQKDGTIVLYNTANGKAIDEFKGHTQSVKKLSFTEDGQYLFSADVSGEIRVWNLVTGAGKVLLIDPIANIETITVAPDAKYLAYSKPPNGIEIIRLTSEGDSYAPDWSIRTDDIKVPGQLLKKLRNGDPVSAVIISKLTPALIGQLKAAQISRPSKKAAVITQALSSLMTGDAGIYEQLQSALALRKGAPANPAPPVQDLVLAVRLLLEEAYPEELGKAKTTITNGTIVTAITFTPDDTLIAAGDKNGKLQLFNTLSGKQVYELKGLNSEINSIVFSKDGSIVSASGKNTETPIWDVGKGVLLKVLPTSTSYGLGFSLDGEQLISVNDKLVTVGSGTTLPGNQPLPPKLFDNGGWDILCKFITGK